MNKIFFFAIILCFCSCIDRMCDDAGIPYEFEIPLRFEPARDTFNIGDTITVEIRFSQMTFERTEAKRFDIGEFNFDPVCSIDEISDVMPNDGLDYFDLLTSENSEIERFFFQSGNSLLCLQYMPEGEELFCVFKLVAKRTGLFFIKFGDVLELEKIEPNVPGGCRNRGVRFFFHTNGGGGNNVEFLLNSPDTLYSHRIYQRAEVDFHKGGGYVFYVVE